MGKSNEQRGKLQVYYKRRNVLTEIVMEPGKKYNYLLILLVTFSLTVFISGRKDVSIYHKAPHPLYRNDKAMAHKMKMTIGSKSFTVTLVDNNTVNAFKAMLPLRIDMRELNGNEKFFYLSATLPANASNPGTIHAGDLMLYENNCLVIFYKSFKTSYSYTRMGKVDNVTGLEEALGTANVMVSFELL